MCWIRCPMPDRDDPVGVSSVESSLTRTPSYRSTRFRVGFLSNTLRRNHLLLLYAFAGFLLLRMWFFAFSRHDSKLISFCAFIMLLAAYIWWSRRGRLARQSRQAALVEQMVAEGRLPIVITQRRLHEEMGITAEGKQALRFFEYSAEAYVRVKGEDDVKSTVGVKDEEAGTMAPDKDDGDEGSATTAGAVTLAAAAAAPAAAESTISPERDVEQGFAKDGEEGSTATSGFGLDPHVHIDQSCAVCLTDYEDGDRLCILPCLHCYHAGCIEIWLANHSRCPLCNHDCNEVGTVQSDRRPLARSQ